MEIRRQLKKKIKKGEAKVTHTDSNPLFVFKAKNFGAARRLCVFEEIRRG